MTISAVLEDELILSPSLPPPGGPAVFIAVGSTSASPPPVLLTTEDTDASTWIDRSAALASVAPNAVLQDVCYSTGTALDRWVAVGYDDSSFGDPVVIYSDDGGNTWTAATASPSTNFMIESVCWTGAKFIAVGHDSSFVNSRVMNSPDGITWTSRTSTPTDSEWHGVSGISGLAIAVGGTNISGTPPRAMTSSNDGDSWTQHDPSNVSTELTYALDVVCVEITGALHVLVGGNVNGDKGIETSPTGTSWTARTNSTNDMVPWGICHNGTRYVAVGYDYDVNVEGRVVTSSDGITWITRTGDPNGPVDLGGGPYDGPWWRSVAALSTGECVAVGQDNNTWTIPYLMYSADGITWTARSLPVSGCILQGVGSTG